MISSGITTITCFMCLTIGIYLKDQTELNTTGNVFVYIGLVLWVCVFGLQIWGGIIIFPHWDEWKKKLNQFPCNQHIFKFGFSMLTIFWLFFGASINVCLRGKLDKSWSKPLLSIIYSQFYNISFSFIISMV